MATEHPSTRSDFYVYALFRETGVPFYIGKGRGHRWACHEWDARNGAKSHKCEIIRSMHTRNFAVIKLKLHEELTEAVAHEYEMALIKAIGRLPRGPLVNLTAGGDGTAGWTAVRGKKQSPEHVAKRIAPHIGKIRPAEARANMSAAQRGRAVSEAHRLKLSIANRGKKMAPDSIARTVAAHLGAKRSPETRAKISAAKLGKPINRGRKWSPEHIAKRSATRRANNERRRNKALAT